MKRLAAGPLSLEESLRIGQGVLSGIAQIHLGGYLHLDIRPPNILFNAGGNPLVADFGQARRINVAGVVTVPETYFHSMPPETLNRGVATSASDIYQVGLLLCRAVNGDALYTKQFAGKSDNRMSAEIDSGKFPDRSKFLPHVPKRLKSIIRKALSVDPSDRQSATQMADSLATVCLDLNWEVTYVSDEIRWVARRGSVDLIVKLSLQDWNSKWKVSVFTNSNGKERAKGKDLYWRESLTSSEADKHLRSVFAEIK